MSAYGITQVDAVEEILDTIYNLLKSESSTMQVDLVVRGDTMTGAPKGKTLWIFPDLADCTHTAGLTEYWRMRIQLVATVVDADRVRGQKRAHSIINNAMSALVICRRLDKGMRFVQDVKKERVQFMPPRAPEARTGILSCGGIMQITFALREGEAK